MMKGKLHPLLIPLIALSFLALWTVLAFYYSATLEEGYRMTLRSSARTAMVFFMLAFVANPLAYLGIAPWTRWLLRQRRQLGVATGLGMLWHIIFIVAFFSHINRVPPLTVIILAGSGLALAMFMLLTSNDYSVRLLGRNWRRLHRLGLYYLWLIYVGAAVAVIFDTTGSGAWIGWIMMLVLAIGLFLRLFAWRTKRQVQSYMDGSIKL